MANNDTIEGELIDLGRVSTETQGALAFGMDDTQPSAKYATAGIQEHD